MLTVKQGAKKAGVCASLFYCWIHAGMLPHYRIGKPGSRGSIRVAEADLDAFLSSLKHEKEPEEISPPAPQVVKKKTVFRHLTIK